VQSRKGTLRFMESHEKRDRGQVRIDENECKGCGLCVEACPTHLLAMGEGLNHYGYRTAQFAGSGCTACGLCYAACPEPGAITVYRCVVAEGVLCASNG